jgi:maltose O-acetyltransferase
MTYNHLSEPSKPVYLVCRALNFLRHRAKKYAQRIRYLSYLPRLGEVGDEIILDSDIYINKPHNISIGNGTFIGQGVTLNAIDKISFGENCGIAAGSYFMTWNHVIDDRTVELRATGKESAPVHVGDGAWVGYNAVVLPGVDIGTGAVVAAGAVVTEDVPDWTVAGGVPASPMAVRTDDGLVSVSNTEEAVATLDREEGASGDGE